MIRKTDLDNLEEILAVINRSDREAYEGVIPDEYFKNPYLSFEDILEEFYHMTFYVYKVDGEIVGVLVFKVESKEICWVKQLFILPEHQRRGIGTELMAHAEGKAREIGLKKLRLRTGMWSKAYWTINFYKKGRGGGLALNPPPLSTPLPPS